MSATQNQRPSNVNYTTLVHDIKTWGRDLGFASIGITDTELSAAETHLLNWLRAGRHGTMHYMTRHGDKRSRPRELVPGTLRVVSARMDYWPEPSAEPRAILDDSTRGYVSRYALGRDYHTLVRKRLQQLARRIEDAIGAFGYRVFADSAPVLEKALAEKAGLGWIGKHSNLLHDKTGSWFFLGEIYTDLPLPIDAPSTNHCGTCHACIDACPTQAIVAPYEVDARRCISYLTIELRDAIPIELRPLIGNRIYGCDDCQLVCPWNKFSRPTREAGFLPRHALDEPRLLDLFTWSEAEFLKRTEGSAIRRIGYACWLRNIAVALGNAPTAPDVIDALRARANDASELVREHVTWALRRHGA